MFDIWHYDFKQEHVAALIKAFPATTTEGCNGIVLGGFAKWLQVAFYYAIRISMPLFLFAVGWWFLCMRSNSTPKDSQKQTTTHPPASRRKGGQPKVE